jgi:hypothetical protein
MGGGAGRSSEMCSADGGCVCLGNVELDIEDLTVYAIISCGVVSSRFG